MNIVDIIFLIMLAGLVILGVFKGIIKSALAVLGIFVVSTLTATIAPFVQSWFAGVIDNENTRSVIAMIVAAAILTVGYSLLAIVVRKLLTNITIVSVLDKVLGGVLGLAIVYLSFAVVFALFLDTNAQFMPLLKGLIGDSFKNSWVGGSIYKNNFFGNWIIDGIANKLLEHINGAATNLIGWQI